MNPPSMESIFLILSGVILMAGVLYWLWSHIQLTQKKVQLLENAVFELRGMLGSGPGQGPGSGSGIPAAPPASPTKTVVIEEPSAATVSAASSSLSSDEEEDWKSTPLEELPALSVAEPDDLQPGGRAMAGGSDSRSLDIDFSDPPAFAPAPATVEVTDTTESFRNLFSSPAAPAPASAPASSSSSVAGSASLDNMPLKELRRLGEQRGIAGAADMRKKELLAALRQQVTAPILTPGSLDDTVKEVNIESAAAAGVSDLVDVTTENAEILE